MIDLDALVAEAKKLVSDAEPELVPIVLAGRQMAVRFLPMMGDEWQKLGLKHPPRADILQDIRLGYNVDAVVAAYPDLALVDGDEVDDMIRVDAEGKSYSKWPAIWGALTATGRTDVSAALWAAHERDPEKLVVDAGKDSPVSRKKKPS